MPPASGEGTRVMPNWDNQTQDRQHNQESLGGSVAMGSEFPRDLSVPSWYVKCQFLFSVFHEGIHCNYQTAWSTFLDFSTQNTKEKASLPQTQPQALNSQFQKSQSWHLLCQWFFLQWSLQRSSCLGHSLSFFGWLYAVVMMHRRTLTERVTEEGSYFHFIFSCQNNFMF